MSFESLNARISALHETTKHVSILIERLQKLDFQPGSLPLDLDDVDEEGNVVAELSQEIRESLRDENESLEIVEQEVKDFPGGKQGSHNALLKESLEQLVSKAQRDITESNASFRDAILTAKKKLAAAQQLEKEIVIASIKNPEPISTASSPISPTYRPNRTKQAPLTAEEKEVAASADVTAALRRTHNLMLSELSRSQFANQTLEESTAALAELSEKYSTLETLLAGSRNLLSSLVRSQKSDTWYLETAVYILVATIGWLVFRRFIYGPAWWLVWLPLKLFYRAWLWVFVALGMRGSGDVGSGMAGVGKVMQSERPSLIVHNQATRAPKVEGQTLTRRPPVVKVGGGGKGAPMRNLQPGQIQEPEPREGSMVEEVGRIIDEGNRNDDTRSEPEQEVVSERKAEEPEAEQQEEIIPNPKKRMFDTEVEEKKEQQWKKDEL